MSAEEALLSGLADSAAVDSENPWPGLLAFREIDQNYFQGRQTETEDLLRFVMRDRLTVLFGLSGLGKSSLLQAGLFPRLRHENVFPVFIRLDFSSAKPDLVAQVSAAMATEAVAHQVEAPPAHRGETLWEYFHREGTNFWNVRNRLVTPILVFDQFEEIFTIGRLDPERATASDAFIEQLADLTEGRPPAGLKARMDERPEEADAFSFGRHHYKILLSIREDFLPDLEALRAAMPAVALNRMRLRRMNGEAAFLVVNQAQHLIDADVAERVVRFVAAGHSHSPLASLEVEPALISVVCRELNNARRVQGLPKITDVLLEGSQQQVLTDFYERSTADLAQEVRFFIEDHLLTVSGYRDSAALENALSIPGVSRQALDRLVERRLVRREDRGGTPRLEITHDLLAGVVCASRDRRRQEEAAERERLAVVRAQQHEAFLKARRDRQLFAIAAVVFLVLTVVAIGAAVWAFRAHRVANIALARSALRDAADLATDEHGPQSLAYLAQALRLDPTSVVARNWAADQMLRKSWWLPLRPLRLKDGVVSAVFSRDGLRVVTASQDGTAQVWEADTGKPMGVTLQHAERVNSAVFSPDGQRVVTASNDQTAQVWEADTGEKIGGPLQHRGVVYSATFSPDGRRVVTASEDGTAQVWDADTGKGTGMPLLHKGVVYSAMFSPDGRRVVTASGDKTAQVWDADTGKVVAARLQHKGKVYSAVFSSDGRRVVTASQDGTAQVWDAETGKRIGTPLLHTGRVNSAEFSADGRRVVTASDDKTGQVWDAETGKKIGAPLQHRGVVSYAVFSPDGRRVVTASQDGTAQVWEPDTGKKIGPPLQHNGTVHFATFGADSQRVLTASADQTAQVWQAYITTSVEAPLLHKEQVRSAEFSADGRRVVTASDDRTAQVWDADSAKPVGAPLQHKDRVLSAAFSADGRRVVTASQDSTAQVWEADTGKAIGTPLRHKGQVNSAEFSADGRRVVTASQDNTAQVWEVDTGKKIGTPLLHEGAVNSAEFSADGRYVVTASDDRTAQVWEVDTGKKIGVPLRHSYAINSATFSPDGRRVVTASQDNTAQVWDADTGKAIGTPLRHKGQVNSAEFSPDGRRVVTASQDNTAQVWDADTGTPLEVPLQHEDVVYSAGFSADGQRVVTASQDGTAQVWEADTGKTIGTPLRHRGAVHSAVFSADGRRVVTASDDGTAQMWDVLIDSGTREDAGLLADVLEAMGGFHINELASLVPLSRKDQAQRLDQLRQRLAHATDEPRTVTWFLRRFFFASETSPTGVLKPLN